MEKKSNYSPRTSQTQKNQTFADNCLTKLPKRLKYFKTRVYSNTR